MTVFITQHANLPALAKLGVISNPIAAAVGLTSAAVLTLSTQAEYVRVNADGGSYLGLVGTALIGSSTVALTSTNALRITANGAPELFAVSAGAKIICAST